MWQKLNAIIARGEEPAPEMSMGEMVLWEKTQLARIKLLNTTSVEEYVPKGEAYSTNDGTSVKQGCSLMIVDWEVNEVPTRLLVDTGALHNFLSKQEAKALGVKFTRVDGEMKAINSKATPVYGRAWGVPVRLGKRKGKFNFLVVDIDDEDVGRDIGIKVAQLKEQDVRVSALKAWWAPRQRRQDAVHGRIKVTKILGTKHRGIPIGGTTRLKCGVNGRDGQRRTGASKGRVVR
uniref:Uncharacterized protein n=1 Tax=Chenopodium quinoa TaxID=63459 RepID=A0A803N9K4_CHEQI